jgi:hypothetical protein
VRPSLYRRAIWAHQNGVRRAKAREKCEEAARRQQQSYLQSRYPGMPGYPAYPAGPGALFVTVCIVVCVACPLAAFLFAWYLIRDKKDRDVAHKINVDQWVLWCQQAARTKVAGPEAALFARPANQRWHLSNAGQPAGATPIFAPPNSPFCERGKGILPNSVVSFACQADKHHLCAVVYKQPSSPDFVCSCTCGHAQ